MEINTRIYGFEVIQLVILIALNENNLFHPRNLEQNMEPLHNTHSRSVLNALAKAHPFRVKKK